MRKIISILSVVMIVLNVQAYAADDDREQINGRVDEIVYGVLGDVSEEDTMNYLEAAVCINKVAGLSDNSIIGHEIDEIIDEGNDKLLSSRQIARRWFLGDYLYAVGYTTVFQPKQQILVNDAEVLGVRSLYSLWSANFKANSTIGNAVELAVNCVRKEECDYKREGAECGLYNGDEYDSDITVDGLKSIMRNMFTLSGELYFPSDLDNGMIDSAYLSSDDMTYYERYKKRMNFKDEVLNIHGTAISVKTNDFGAKLIGFRELCEIFGMTVEWDNGKIKLTNGNGTYDIRLDDFEGNRKMLTDRNIFAYHPKVDEFWHVIFDKSVDCFGQYEMINDRIYLYPETFRKFTEHMDIDSGITPDALMPGAGLCSDVYVEKDYGRMSDVKPKEEVLCHGIT